VLGLWSSATEGAKLWLLILREIRNRGVADILVACVDGLKGFPDAISTVYSRSEVQLCIVHMVRNSLAYVNWNERKVVAADLSSIYRTPTAEVRMTASRSVGTPSMQPPANCGGGTNNSQLTLVWSQYSTCDTPKVSDVYVRSIG
jgi:transposase-like protein